MNRIVIPAERRGFWAAFRDFNWEACSRFLMVCIDTRLPWCPRYRICRLRAVMRRFLKVARQIEQYTLSVVIRGLPLLGLSFTSCVSLYRSRSLDMVLWLTPKSTAKSRCFHQASKWPMALPDPHWTTSPSLPTNMLKFRSTPRTWMQKCTIWLTVSNKREKGGHL